MTDGTCLPQPNQVVLPAETLADVQLLDDGHSLTTSSTICFMTHFLLER
jgi:hypothetical protein